MQKFKDFIKAYRKTLLFFGIIGLVGGFFVGLYTLDSYPADMKQQLIDELKSSGLGDLPADIVMAIISAYQAIIYGFLLGAIGIFLGKRIGLWRDERSIEKKPLIITLVIALIGGLALILSDVFVFGPLCSPIMESYAEKPSIPYLIATVTYGAVIEEVMLRLFWMSLVAFLLHKIFDRGRDQTSTTVLLVANVISALLFAAGHLPATFAMIGSSSLIIARCFLLNGGIGLLFGYLYRRYGLRYAMIAHGGCHIVSKLIWILFI